MLFLLYWQHEWQRIIYQIAEFAWAQQQQQDELIEMDRRDTRGEWEWINKLDIGIGIQCVTVDFQFIYDFDDCMRKNSKLIWISHETYIE